MPNVLPSKAASHYLDAIGAAAIYIALPRIGAASVRGLRRLPRGAGDIQWIAWVRDLASAKTVAATDLALQQHDDGVRRCRPLPEIVAAIEQRARDLGVPLTPHERAVERAMVLAATCRRHPRKLPTSREKCARSIAATKRTVSQ